ncbi:MAG: Na/Pi symporter [Burkholderiales bacterium]
MLALREMLIVIAPYENTPSLRLVLGVLASEPLIGLLIAALLTWVAHSSVAIVLLVMSLVAQGIIPLTYGLAMVLGANLGTAINPLLEAPTGGDPTPRRLTLGNLLSRVVSCVPALMILDAVGPMLMRIEPDPARAVADFHTAFNLFSAVLFLPCWDHGRECCVGSYRRVSDRSIPAGPSI